MMKFVKWIFIVCTVFLLIPGNTTFAAEKNLYKQLNQLKSTQQVIIVTGKPGVRQATTQTFEKMNGKWKQTLKTIPTVVGKYGIGEGKEGYARTPIGVYKIGKGFGWANAPSGLKMDYKQTNRFHYWIDDVTSNDYNKWVYYGGNPWTRWKSFERLTHPLYKHAFIIRYNDNPIVKGKGSAIFFHIWDRPNGYTAGCVAVSETDLLSIMRWLNPKKKPLIIIGNSKSIGSYIVNYKQ